MKRLRTAAEVEKIVNRIDLTVSGELDGNKLVTSNTKWAQVGYFIFSAGNQYTITGVSDCEYIETSEPLPAGETYTLQKPFFFHGTVIQINEELTQIKDLHSKTPMIYLREIYREIRYPNSDKPYILESDLTLFFLTSCDFQRWQVEDHYREAITPMHNLVEEFLQKCKPPYTETVREEERLNRVNFGVYVADNGSKKKVLNDNLSGVQLNVNLKFKKGNYNCNPTL